MTNQPPRETTVSGRLRIGARYIPLLIFVLTSLLLALLVKDFIRAIVVQPLLYFLWYLSLFLNSLSELVFWFFFILLALIVAFRSFSEGKDARYTIPKESVKRDGSVAVWARLIDHAAQGGYSKWQLSQALNRLTWNIMGSGERLSLQKIDEQVRNGTLNLPPEIRGYFRAGMSPYQPQPRFGRRKLDEKLVPLELDPEVVIRFLEEELDPMTGETDEHTNQ